MTVTCDAPRVLTLWSHDRLDRSILRVLEGDDGEDTHLSGTSGTGDKSVLLVSQE